MAVVQALLCFEENTWVMIPRMVQDLGRRGGVQHGVAQQITGKKYRRLLDGKWEYPPLWMVIQEAGFEEMEEYVLKRHSTVAKHVVLQPILDIFKKMVHIPVTWVVKM